jgi:hypothetical protein
MSGSTQVAERMFSVLRGAGPSDGAITVLEFAEPFRERLRIFEKDREWRPSAGDSELCRILVVPAFSKDDLERKEAGQAWVRDGFIGGRSAGGSVKIGEASVSWNRGRVLLAYGGGQGVGQLEELLECVADFVFVEGFLSELEREVLQGWAGVEEDTPLAYKIGKADLARDEEVGRRAKSVLQLRIRHVRAEPRVLRGPARFGRLAAEFGERLREEARFEERLEALDGQIEAQEYVYELASQRFGEFRHAREGFLIEVIIVALLAAEVVLLLLELWW